MGSLTSCGTGAYWKSKMDFPTTDQLVMVQVVMTVFWVQGYPQCPL